MGAGGHKPVLIGRMHANGPDQLHGYSDRLVDDQGPNHSGGYCVDHGPLSGKAGHGQSAYQVHDEDVTAATVAYLNRLGVKKRAGQLSEPFSLPVGFMLPHQPYVARRQDLRVLLRKYVSASKYRTFWRPSTPAHQTVA